MPKPAWTRDTVQGRLKAAIVLFIHLFTPIAFWRVNPRTYCGKTERTGLNG